MSVQYCISAAFFRDKWFFLLALAHVGYTFWSCRWLVFPYTLYKRYE
jgi:hypothetical protein